MVLALILIPFAAAGLAALTPSNRRRPWLLPAGALAHLAIALFSLSRIGAPMGYGPWLALDPVGQLVLLVSSLVSLASACAAVPYLAFRNERPNRVFCACLLIFPGLATVVACSQHLGLTWVAIEATTLVTAPLIYFNRTPRSIEATWKYLLVGSVGIALALLGTFFLAYAAVHAGLDGDLTLTGMLEQAPRLSKPWVRAGWVLLLVGYGTKMGLAPMHTWKPDAYGEAPGLVGAVLAGGVTSCAFLALLRVHHICTAAGLSAFTARMLLPMGLVSMAIAGLFMLRQRDFKRMLAYSSVEHMGVLAIGLGLGAPALLCCLLHLVNNALTKGALFLAAGNLHRAYGSKLTDDVRGAWRHAPVSASIFVLALFAITGSPPFSPFISLFGILNAAFATGHGGVAGLFLVCLMLVFIGMGATVLRVAQGQPHARARDTVYRDRGLTLLAPLALMAAVVWMGLHCPAPLNRLIHAATRHMETTP